MLAAVAGHVAAFNVLLDRGSAIHKSVLHIAAVENHTDVLQVSVHEYGNESINYIQYMS
jgi:hypothetical protein